MWLLRIAAVLLLVGGCSDKKDPPSVDAPVSIDAPSQIDAPSGNACTGAVYDPCTDNTQCMSGNCHLYSAQLIQVCVTTCTPGNNATCPVDKTGVNGICNNMGICRPAAANDCTR